MSRKNVNARVIKYGEAKRGRHRDHAPLYGRVCDECGFFEFSKHAAFLTTKRRCPNCNA